MAHSCVKFATNAFFVCKLLLWHTVCCKLAAHCCGTHSARSFSKHILLAHCVPQVCSTVCHKFALYCSGKQCVQEVYYAQCRALFLHTICAAILQCTVFFLWHKVCARAFSGLLLVQSVPQVCSTQCTTNLHFTVLAHNMRRKFTTHSSSPLFPLFVTK